MKKVQLRKFTKKERQLIAGHISYDDKVLDRPKLVVISRHTGANKIGDVAFAIAKTPGNGYEVIRNSDVCGGVKNRLHSWWEDVAKLATQSQIKRFITGRNTGDTKRMFKLSDYYEAINRLKL